MKIKQDFITNSSSASFIIYIESLATNLEEFEKCWQKYIDYFTNSYKYRLNESVEEWRQSLEESWKSKLETEEKIKNGTATPIEKTFFGLLREPVDPKNITDDEIMKMVLGEMTINSVVGNVYSVGHFTVMFNDFDDLPKWMVELIIMNNMKSPELISFGFKDIKLEIEDRKSVV